MSTPPQRPKIYHITHVNNLASIIQAGGLLPDSVITQQGGPSTSIGMGHIKKRRLQLPVKCHPGTFVGEYVPFYFCPRSIMLYLIHRRNSELAYQAGQGAIVHLEADLHQTVTWAGESGRQWAVTLSNAGAHYTEFRDQLTQLGDVDWRAVEATDFRDRQVKEGKQAEFLVYGFFCWQLVQRIGVQSKTTESQVQQILVGSVQPPTVQVLPNWYF